MNVRGILFDSGDTLVFPRGGSWWPGPDFHSVLKRHGLTAPEDRDAMAAALEEGDTYLGAHHSAADLTEETEEFRGYYRTVCRRLGLAGTDDGLIEDLASAYVDGCNLELFPDAVDTLARLANSRVTLGVLSDAWPSLEKKYVALGIRKYFRSFTISAEVGCCKPCDKIYLTAIDDIGVDAQDILFIDDDLENVRAAIRLGMKGTVISRNKQSIAGDTPVIRDLHSIFELIS
jgi:putative hydrolase of the HAD superfamily